MEKKHSHIIYGLITGLVMAVTGLVIYYAGVAFTPGMQYIAYIPFLVGIILNAVSYSKSKDGFVTFGNVFGNCFKAAMVVTLIMVVWSLLSMVIFPEMKEKAITMAREQMMKKQMTDEQMDTAVNMTRKYWNAFLIAGAVFGNLFWGAIFSLIGGAIAKKKGPQPFVTPI